MHVHVALSPAWCTHVSCSVMYTFNAKTSDGGRKKSKEISSGRAVGLPAHYGDYVLCTMDLDLHV